MHSKKPSQLIHWDIKSFLVIICFLQLAVLGSIGLDIIGLKIPIIRQLIGFVYLSFVPGILIIRLLKLNNLKNTEVLLYSVGLSLFTLMLIGLLLNTFGHYFIPNPISTISLILAISFVVIMLSYLCYKFDRKLISTYEIKEKSDTKSSFLSPAALFLLLIPFMSILGTYLVNYYSNNLLLLFLIVIICLVIILIGFDTKYIPTNLYPLAIFVIAISLLLHDSLIFNHLYGWDVHQEYYYSNLVKTSGFWHSNIPSDVNSMLSIVFLAPIYSDICNLSLTWVFKIIYPLLFSFLPLGLFQIYKKQTENEITAFLSVIYFMSISTFYTEMLALERQQIAELFFVILISIFICNIELSKKRLLTLIFVFGLAISHYGLSYLILSLILINYMFFKYILRSKSDVFRSQLILIFFIFTISWYMYSSNGSLIQRIALLFSHFYNTILEEFFATKATEIIISNTFNFWNEILIKLYEISQIFIVIGFSYVVKNFKKLKFTNEYISFSFMLFVALGFSIVNSNTGMNIHRLYHIASILLAVYFIIGGSLVLSMINQRLSLSSCKINSSKILTLFLILFLLINIGFVQEVSKMDPTSISISQSSLMVHNNTENIYDKMSSSSRPLYRYYISDQDFYGTIWLSNYKNSSDNIYADSTAKEFSFVSYGMMPRMLAPYSSKIHDLSDPSPTEQGAYIYFRYINIVYGLVSNGLFSEKENAYLHLDGYLNKYSQKNKIYTNGANWVLK